MQLSLLSAISFSHLPRYSLGHHQNKLSLTLLFLFLLNPVLSYLQKLPKLSPHLEKPNRSITQNSADICHATKAWLTRQCGFCQCGFCHLWQPLCQIVAFMDISCIQTRAIRTFLSHPWLYPGAWVMRIRKGTWAWGGVKGTVVDTSQALGEHLKDSHGVFLLLSPPAAATTTQIQTWFSLENKPAPAFHWGTWTLS